MGRQHLKHIGGMAVLLVLALSSNALAGDATIMDMEKAVSQTDTNEAACMLKMAKALMARTRGHLYGLGMENFSEEGWTGIEFEKQVYFSKNKVSGVTDYTLYGSSKKHYPHEFKLQMAATYGEAEGGLAGCTLGDTMSLTSADGTKLVSFEKSYGTDTYMYGISPIPYLKEKPEQEPHADFNAERAYAGKDGESKSMQIVLDKDQLNQIIWKEGGGFLTDMAAAKVLKRSKNMSRGFRLFKYGMKGYLVLDRAGHVVSAYDAVMEGGEPKPIAIGELLDSKTYSRFLGGAASYLSETGVLKAPGAYIDDFEEPHKHQAAKAEPVKAETHSSQPAATPPPPATNDALKKALEENAPM